MLPPTRNVRTATTTTTGTSGCSHGAAQLTVIAGASCFRTTNGLINYVFDISPPHSPSPCLTLSLSVCHSGIDDVAGAALEARVQIKFTIMTTQMDSVMGEAASGKWNWKWAEEQREQQEQRAGNWRIGERERRNGASMLDAARCRQVGDAQRESQRVGESRR